MPDYAQPFNNRGLSYAHKAEFDRAIQENNDAIRLNPDNLVAFSNRRNAFANMGEYDRAIQDDQANLLNPNLGEAFNNRGRAHNNSRGEYDLAILDLDQAIRLEPRAAALFDNRGNAFVGKHEFDRAIQDFDQAIRLKPNLAEPFNNRGLAYAGKQQYDRAIWPRHPELRPGHTAQPDYPGAINGRGLTRFDNGQFAAATQDHAPAVQIAPARPYNAIWLYLAQARAG
jgi:lipoprotein NlpI